jgi:hypothetical protein
MHISFLQIVTQSDFRNCKAIVQKHYNLWYSFFKVIFKTNLLLIEPSNYEGMESCGTIYAYGDGKYKEK